MRKRSLRWIFWILGLGIAVAGISLWSLSVGPAQISFKEIIACALKGTNTTEYSILFGVRLPRIILGFAIGGALSLAGVILQGMFRNPLVEPYTLGISGGAAIGVCMNIVLRLSNSIGLLSLPISGFIGALSVVLIIYSLCVRKRILKIQGLLLTGVMVSFVSSSLIMLIMSVSRREDLHGILFWIMGSLEEPSWMLIKAALGISLLGLIVSYIFCFDLNAFSLGEEEAFHLGINVEKTKRLLFTITSLLTGFSVSVAGIIGFVGLVVPHFMRMFIGSDHRILLVSSFLCGAGFLIFCDTVARIIIAPMELPVGVITGIIGGCLFIYALTKRQNVLGEK